MQKIIANNYLYFTKYTIANDTSMLKCKQTLEKSPVRSFIWELILLAPHNPQSQTWGENIPTIRIIDASDDHGSGDGVTEDNDDDEHPWQMKMMITVHNVYIVQ